MKKLLSAFAFLIAATTIAHGQCGVNYVIEEICGCMVPGTDPVPPNGNFFPLPFPYTLYDQTFTSARVLSSNGVLEFDANAASGCPGQAGNGYIIEPYARVNMNVTARTSVTGEAPNRIFNIEWKGQELSSIFLPTHFEVKLYEGQRRFDVVYGVTSSDNFRWASAGVQKDSTNFTRYFCTGDPVNTPPFAEGAQSYTLDCPTPTPTPTPTATATPSGTPRPTPTPRHTSPRPRPTPAPR